MSEVTVPAALSGREVVEAIVDKVRKLLHEDCYLNPDAAYQSFNARIHVEFRGTDCGRYPEVDKTIEVESEAKVDDDAALNIAEAQFFDQPPNEVRLETGQPIPTLVETGDGKKEIKPVRYGRKKTEEI